MTNRFRIFPNSDLQISMEPLRKVNTVGAPRVTAEFSSRKMGKAIPCESLIELDFLIRAELDPEVEEIYAQPVELTLEGQRRHIPDFALGVNGLLEIHEVKVDWVAARPETAAKLKAAARHVEERGAPYLVALQSFLRAPPIYERLNDIFRRLHEHVSLDTRLAVLDQLQNIGPISIRDAALRTRRWGATEERVLALVAQGDIRIDLTTAICPESMVWSADSYPYPTRLIPDFAMGRVDA